MWPETTCTPFQAEADAAPVLDSHRPYWIGAGAETTYTPAKPDAAPVRLIVRRVKPKKRRNR